MSDPNAPEPSRCAVQHERDGRHAIFHSPECDGTRCGIELIELPSDHDPHAYDHLKGAGTLHLGPGFDLLPEAAQADLRAAAAGFTAEGTQKACTMKPCEPGPPITITPWSAEEVAELQAVIDGAEEEPEPRPLTVADLADMERRADITDSIDHVCDDATMADLRRLIAELKRIHGKVHERAAAIEGRPMDDGELASIRTTYENHLARGNYVHPMTHDVGRLLGEVDRLRKRHASPVPDWFYGGSRVPTDMSTDSYSHAVAAAAAGLLVHIDATPYAYPEVGQDPADFARDQLAHVAAAALWTLVTHAAHSGDDHHLETFTEALINTDRLPAAVVEPLAPAFAQLLGAALPAIIDSINPPDRPEVIS